MRILIFIIVLFSFTTTFAVQNILSPTSSLIKDGGKKGFKKKRYQKKHFVRVNPKKFEQKKQRTSSRNSDIKQHTKGKAILMAILTGPLGGHRLYLGTKPYVPIVYALTLGGGLGLLPAVDIVVIILSKDLNKYYNNPQIMMW